MNRLLLALAFLSGLVHAAPAPIDPASVAVLYNSDEPDSRDLALYYAKQRRIPENNLVGLPMPKDDLVSREAYNNTLRDPLRKVFHERSWWSRNGSQITSQSIRVLVCVRGVPFGIQRSTPPAGAEAVKGAHQLQDEAAVDSELALLGHEGLQIAGALNNPYFKNEEPASSAKLQGILLVGRLDGPSFALCKRLIDDAIETEKEGLWGMCYLDRAQKGGAYQVGEDWIRGIATKNSQVGIPSVIDRNPDTYVTNYPMSNAALYFGWYIPHANGPFRNDTFRFKRGAVAVHIHSFSATTLRSPKRHWSGPLLDKGAAATVGNVFEPFLSMTHHLNLLHDRLLAGHSLVEAAYMSTPVLSWQGLVLGDPLYRPFAQFSSSETSLETDRAYKALRAAWMRWPDDEETRITKMRSAAARSNSGPLYEALGLFYLQQGQNELGGAFFNSASKHYGQAADRLRQELHRINLLREANRKQEAIDQLRLIQPEYRDIPEGKAITALLLILDPPAPPPAKATNREGTPTTP